MEESAKVDASKDYAIGIYDERTRIWDTCRFVHSNAGARLLIAIVPRVDNKCRIMRADTEDLEVLPVDIGDPEVTTRFVTFLGRYLG